MPRPDLISQAPDAPSSVEARAADRTSSAQRVRNWALAALGGLSLGVGILGVFVPGLPTTIFLILASWLFTRSCPELDRWMRSHRIVQPYVKYLDGARIPAHVTPVILLFIWIGVTAAIVSTSGLLLTTGLVLLGAIGSGFVLRRTA